MTFILLVFRSGLHRFMDTPGMDAGSFIQLSLKPVEYVQRELRGRFISSLVSA